MLVESLISQPLLSHQSFVLGSCLPENRNVWVGVLPQRKEPIVGAQGSRAIVQRVGACQSELRERPDRVVHDQVRQIENFLEFGGGRCAISRGEVRLPAQIDGIQRESSVPSELIRCSGLQLFERLRNIV